ncbi:lipid A deacylase LpxR family protein [Chromohalobacter canadensis]|uniref:lipid A deacylase LpxR family protein n=1 Tax=Chromohalobacter canadensis TaxID=141389 RepID=UPI0021BEEA0B|nr:lipid A deacylase LpxR family protein [Chromohalobacter canadensis]MCT8467757.1 lipid A deacylase LpxR family protein [Chromohalobacter canadensis]MCT8470495.1 lipid A deacylase LpxR family protein [Chromohalobacter canadensis]MCT8498254.1 lipid A deacylase LpxR family protein [Chromohalobacter canadensis]
MNTGRTLGYLASTLAFAVFSSPALADGMLTLKSENDLFASGDDGHYTNGLEINWSFTPDERHWTRRLADAVPGWSGAELDGVAYRAGQQIYTPNDIDRADLIQNDRPYAGLLYAGVSLFDDRQYSGWRQADDLHFDAGIVGPASGGKAIQKNFHHLIGSDEPNGWSNQLHNEPVLNLTYKRSWWLQDSLGNLDMEYGPNAGFALGNLYTYAASGVGLRIGDNLRNSAGMPAVAPAQSGRSHFTPGQGFGWYAFASLEGRFMAHNLLLDGNTFEDSHSVDRRQWVGDALTGVALTWDSWQLTYTSVWRTHEFEAQDEHDQFGSLTLSLWL